MDTLYTYTCLKKVGSWLLCLWWINKSQTEILQKILINGFGCQRLCNVVQTRTTTISLYLNVPAAVCISATCLHQCHMQLCSAFELPRKMLKFVDKSLTSELIFIVTFLGINCKIAIAKYCTQGNFNARKTHLSRSDKLNVDKNQEIVIKLLPLLTLIGSWWIQL